MVEEEAKKDKEISKEIKEGAAEEVVEEKEESAEVSAIGDGGGVYQIDVDTGSKANWGKIVAIILAVVILLVLAGGGWYFFMRGDNSGSSNTTAKTPLVKEEVAEKEASSGSEASKEAETIKEEKVDLAEYDVQILNGSGTAGEAGVVEGLLEEAGFEGVDTGNADTYDYTDTQLQMKKGTPKAVYDAISEALSGDYKVTKGDSLDADAGYDVVVIVGQRS